MNYLNIYEKICDRGQIREIDTYTENHHIIPKCLGGDNSISNLTKITAREHFICHWLLTKLYPDNYKIHMAFALMDGSMSKFGKIKRQLSSRHYERCMKARSDAMKLKHKLYPEEAPGKTIASRKSARERWLGDKNPTRVNPEKNHTVKWVKIIFTDGEKKEFVMKKDCLLFLSKRYGKSTSSMKNSINNRNFKNMDIKHYSESDNINKAGEASRGRKWYTDGVNNEFVHPGKQTHNYRKGLTKKEIIMKKEILYTGKNLNEIKEFIDGTFIFLSEPDSSGWFTLDTDKKTYPVSPGDTIRMIDENTLVIKDCNGSII